ncbi:hypothetical protein LCGC14_2406300 [marine sediment metagenome]|uniref:Uncharacterized protein n=1 Tax=marine sediment metagenome TaxID=412755 RepID=A0A0F9EN95_9ZZZZ
MKRARDRRMERFLRLPTKEEWTSELENGWDGPDGSSASTDNIGGIVIGKTSRSFYSSELPANLHDWYYRLGRRKGLHRRFRKAADKSYRNGCLEKVSILVGWAGWKARMRCRTRYQGLRLFGWRAWKYQPPKK